MKALTEVPGQLAQLVWEEGILQVKDTNTNDGAQNLEKLYGKANSKEVLSVLRFLDGYRIFIKSCSPGRMDSEQQQRLLAQLVQQQQQTLQELKRYQVSFQQQHSQLHSQPHFTNLCLAMFASQQYISAPTNPLRNVVPSTATTIGRQQIPSFNPFPGINGANYFPITPSALRQPVFSMPSMNEAQIAELTRLLATNEQQEKNADPMKEDLSKHGELPSLPLPTLHQQVSVPPIVKRRMSESTQQQQTTDSTKTVVKRARVVIVEQKDPEPAPCSSTSSSSVLSPAEKTERELFEASKMEKFGSDNNIGSKGYTSGDDNSSTSNNVNDKERDDEDAQYVDVETVDEKLDSKEQRKALIEFYRKVKSVRVSYPRDDMLVCQMCEQQVQNSDSLILTHLYVHAEVMPYRCKMCGAGECQLERMYAHIRQGHPNKVIDKICELVKEKSLAKLTCMVCTRKISTRKMSITRHAQTHLHYRCKDCGIIVFGDTRIVEHSTKKHGIVDPQCSTHYDACANTSDKTETALKNCFSNILNEKLS